MANISTRQRSAPASYSPGQSLCVIVGLACIVGFAVNIAILALPPSPLSVQWRINLLQQVGDRGIVLLFGAALMMYGFLADRALRRSLALACLAIGVMFSVSGVVTVHDSLRLQDMAVSNIANQEVQALDQIQSARENPQELAPELTPDVLDQASAELSARAKDARQTAKTNLVKAGAGSVGNLIVIGLALIATGRFGLRVTG